MKRSIAVCAAVAVLATGCTSSGGDRGSSGRPSASAGSPAALAGSITVYAASSLTEAFGTVASRFEKAHPGTTVKLIFGASSQLSTQITQGAPADVFASASTKNMTALGRTALSPANFVANTLEIAVPRSNPARIRTVKDLARSGVKVAVCDPTVPCGAVAAQVFRNAGITVRPVAREQDVKSTLAVVESGEVDAGLVYVTDVRAAGDKIRGVRIPAGANSSTEYPIAALKRSKNAALAAAFVAYVRSPAAKAVLVADGFSNP